MVVYMKLTQAKSHYISNKGALLLEVLTALGIGAILVAALTQLGVKSLRESTISQRRSSLTRLAQQGIEAVRSIRDQNIRGAFIDTSCSLVVNPSNDPYADVPTCNEWVDVWRWEYPTPSTFRLSAPNESLGNTFWVMSSSSDPEILDNISRLVTISELTPADPKIKKVTVKAYFTDGTNTYTSEQTTYLRKLPGS